MYERYGHVNKIIRVSSPIRGKRLPVTSVVAVRTATIINRRGRSRRQKYFRPNMFGSRGGFLRRREIV